VSCLHKQSADLSVSSSQKPLTCHWAAQQPQSPYSTLIPYHAAAHRHSYLTMQHPIYTHTSLCSTPYKLIPYYMQNPIYTHTILCQTPYTLMPYYAEPHIHSYLTMKHFTICPYIHCFNVARFSHFVIYSQWCLGSDLTSFSSPTLGSALVQGSVMTLSSYPGVLTSGDDFYVINSGLVNIIL